MEGWREDEGDGRRGEDGLVELEGVQRAERDREGVDSSGFRAGRKGRRGGEEGGDAERRRGSERRSVEGHLV